MIEIETLRNRNDTLEAQFASKHQTRFSHVGDKILTLYTKSMSGRDIVETFHELYNADISNTLAYNAIEAVMEWQIQPLDTI